MFGGNTCCTYDHAFNHAPRMMQNQNRNKRFSGLGGTKAIKQGSIGRDRSIMSIIDDRNLLACRLEQAELGLLG